MFRHLFIALIITVFTAIGCQTNNEECLDYSHLTNYSIPLLTLVDSLELNKGDLSIFIDKSDYTLSILNRSATIKEFPVVFGTNPIDDKLMEGDRSTPEGHFSIRDFYPHKSWSKFIWIDYPTEESWIKHRQAKSDHLIPADATIGGEVGIHGVPKGKSDLIAERINWTWGCISLSNKDINDLYQVIFKHMKIEIVK